MMMSRSRWLLCCVLLPLLAASSVLHKAAARSLLTSELQTSLRGLTHVTTSAATSPIAEFVRNGGPVPSKGAVAATSTPERPPKEKDHKLYLYAW